MVRFLIAPSAHPTLIVCMTNLHSLSKEMIKVAIGLSMIIATELFLETIAGGRAVEGLSVDIFAQGDSWSFLI